MDRRHRVLLIAEAANPEWTSVPLIGWSLSQALAKVTDAHLVTHVRNREAIQRAGLVEGRDFTAIDNESVAAPLWKLASLLRGGAGKGWTTLSAFSAFTYYSFEAEVWRQFGSRIAAREFDLVHRITPLSPTHQSPIAARLAKLNVPFVIGPLNGGVPWPKNFVDRQHAEREWLSHVRGLFKLLPHYRSTRRNSAAIIVGSKYTGTEIPNWARDKCVYIPENAVDLDRFTLPRTHRATLPLQGAFVGRLVPYKGADMLLEATAEFLKQGKLKLHIAGDGPQRPQLEALVDQLDIRESVSFHGWVQHAAIQDILRTCDFLALPSIREFGGGVVVEAMALGVAPIVADYAGPSELVDDATGVRVKFDSRKSLVDGLRQAVGDVLHSPEMLDRLGSAGRDKVGERLTWTAKANQITAIYDAVLNGRNDLNSLSYS
jgi:glycosyltransferase involved in cell wall biosynthesis